MSKGKFPLRLKTARVILIFKTGSKLELKNYRPISTLPFIGKLFERLIHSRLYKFFDRYNIFFEDEYGFVKNKSTADAIIKFTDECYASLDDIKYMISIFLDFSKALNTVNHEILCKKLEFYRFRGFILEWLKSYLTDRSQYVEIQNTKSKVKNISKGVPQG